MSSGMSVSTTLENIFVRVGVSLNSIVFAAVSMLFISRVPLTSPVLPSITFTNLEGESLSIVRVLPIESTRTEAFPVPFPAVKSELHA